MSGLAALPSSIVLAGANRLKPSGGKEASGDMKQAVMGEATGQLGVIRAQAKALDSSTKAHEHAHDSAGGHLSCGICLSYRTVSVAMPDGSTESVTYAAEGTVPLQMPGVPQISGVDPGNRGKLEQARSDAQIVRNAALAPSNPSGADSAIASRASSDLGAISAQLSQLDSIEKDPANPLNPFSRKLNKANPDPTSENTLNVIA